MKYVYKICTLEESDKIRDAHFYEGNELDHSSGFIHLSFAEQVKKIADKFYPGRTDLVILELDAQLLSDKLKIEANKPSGDKYPHYYGKIHSSWITNKIAYSDWSVS